MTAVSTSRCLSLSRWSATSSASSRRPAPSAATRRTTASRVVADGGLRRRGGATDMTDTEGTTMEARAQARYIRVTPMKARRVVDLIRGLDATEAQAVLRFTPQAASVPVGKVLDSAIANAAHNYEHTDAESLFISEAYVDEGPTLKRFRPRAQGRAYRIRKRTSHITVVVASKEGTR